MFNLKSKRNRKVIDFDSGLCKLCYIPTRVSTFGEFSSSPRNNLFLFEFFVERAKDILVQNVIHSLYVV